MEQLIREFVELSQKGKADSADAIEISAGWRQSVETLVEHVLTKDPTRFLQWEFLCNTMCVNGADWIGVEMEALVNDDVWRRIGEKITKSTNFGFPPTTENTVHHCYHLYKFEKVTGVNLEHLDLVFEFGGGYGNMARIFRELGFKGKYIILDLPHFSSLQRFYLRNVGITDVTCMSNMGMLMSMLEESDDHETLFLATWSLSEIPRTYANRLVTLAMAFKHHLIAYQEYYEGGNNDVYFRTIRDEFKSQKYNTYVEPINHIPGNHYLFMTEKEGIYHGV